MILSYNLFMSTLSNLVPMLMRGLIEQVLDDVVICACRHV